MLKLALRSRGPLAAALAGTAALLLTARPADAQHGRRQEQPKRVGPPVDSAAMPRPEKKTGCTTFDVRIAAGTLVTAAPTTPIPCGPIEPVLVASPTFDSAHGTVTLAVALVNRGPDRLHIPTALVAAKPGLVITVGAPTPSPRAAIVQLMGQLPSKVQAAQHRIGQVQ